MSATGLEVFDKTLQTTNLWLKEITETTGPDRHRAYHVLGAVLRALRDRLTVDEVAHLGAQLPLLLRVEEATRAVFAALDRHIAPGEIENVKGVLPTQLRSLWPEEQ